MIVARYNCKALRFGVRILRSSIWRRVGEDGIASRINAILFRGRRTRRLPRALRNLRLHGFKVGYPLVKLVVLLPVGKGYGEALNDRFQVPTVSIPLGSVKGGLETLVLGGVRAQSPPLRPDRT